MGYDCQNFKDGQVLTAACLNKMEQGIVGAFKAVPPACENKDCSRVLSYSESGFEWIPLPEGAEVDPTLTQSGKAADAKAVGDALAVYVLSLSTDEADAQANSDAVTAAIAEHKHVVLKAGKYPVKPGIVIESGKLDMNGAHFYTVDYKSSTPLVYLKGEAPEICNGELEGSYDLADDEEGYEFFESESLIRPEGVNGAYIHHMNMHHNWGYCISPGENVERVYAGTATMTGSVEHRFTSESFEIPEGYKYVTAAGGIGYNYIISISDVVYRFYDENGTEVTKKSGVPRKRIAIPSGAKTVTFDTKPGGDTHVPYYAYFTNYEETLTVAGCTFHNFHSLAMANFPGPTTVARCAFIEGGKPRSDVYGTFRATTGGIDIEDVQTPEFVMSDCYSRDCAKLLMFGGYKGTVTNCFGDVIGIYRGWNCDLSNCNVTRLSANDRGCRVSTNGVHANELAFEGNAMYNVRGNISTNGIPRTADGSVSPELLSHFDSFIVKIETSSSTQGDIAGRLNGRIECTGTTGYRGSGISSEKGSRLEFDVKVADGNRNYYGAVTSVNGEIYGLVANAAFFPNGYTIHDSTFNIAAATTPYSTKDGMLDGGFENCVFNLTGAAYFRKFTGTLTEPITLTFENCIINNADNYLFNYVPGAGGVVTFKNCTIADESKLFNGDASSMTVNIVTGGEGGVDIDASLSVEGAAADAAATGAALEKLEEKMGLSGGGMPKWRLLCDATVTAETDPDGVAAVETTTFADGETLVGAGISEIVFGGWVTQKADTTYAYGAIEVNDAGIIVGQNIGIATGAKRFFTGRVQLLGGGMASVTFGSDTSAQNIDAKGGGVVIYPHGGGVNVPAIAVGFGEEVAKVKVKHATTGGLFSEARFVVFGR